MPHPHRTQILFLLAWSARVAMAPMAAHWGVIGATLAVGLPLSWAADFTLFLTVTLAVGCSLLVLSLRRNPAVQERMRGGATSMLRHWYLVLFAAAASNLGGMALLVRGEPAVAGWAMGLGTFVMVCEVAALVGSAFAGEGELTVDGRSMRDE